ncbi:MAG TPA: manganese catalase family protein [Bacteroidia bacterium]|nr:manganese catalase family protein [Bacteroidia bacterium]
MFYHVKDLQFNARVSKPDPRFARILLDQFGGPNGELKAAMQYFVQAFGCRQAFPKEYDMLMDIATEEFSHLEIVGATIQMLLNGVSGQLKDISSESEIMQLLNGNAAKENVVHEAMTNPQFLIESGGTPTLTDSNGNPWTSAYVNANGDLTVDLRSNIAAESRAKIVYEYLMQFTDDAYVKETLSFLMTREIAHFQMFEAALQNIPQNFPPGVLQGDPRYSNKYFNMSMGTPVQGPWNSGSSTQLNESWGMIEDPIDHIIETNGLLDEEIEGTTRTVESADEKSEELSRMRSKQIKNAIPHPENQWSRYTREEGN